VHTRGERHGGARLDDASVEDVDPGRPRFEDGIAGTDEAGIDSDDSGG